MQQPTGEWKINMGWTIFFLIGFLGMVFYFIFISSYDVWAYIFFSAFVLTYIFKLILNRMDQIDNFRDFILRLIFRKAKKKDEVDEFNYVAYISFCLDLLKNNDFTNIKTINDLDHRKKDIFARKGDFKYLIRCNSAVAKSEEELCADMKALKRVRNVDVRVILSNQIFSHTITKLAEKEGITLWDNDYLDHLIFTAESKSDKQYNWIGYLKNNTI